jgi:hypothetical protein
MMASLRFSACWLHLVFFDPWRLVATIRRIEQKPHALNGISYFSLVFLLFIVVGLVVSLLIKFIMSLHNILSNAV